MPLSPWPITTCKSAASNRKNNQPMLLYVDKKKQKRRQIKIIISTLAVFLSLIANSICLSKALQQTNKHLTKFSPFEHTQPWYQNSHVVTVFTHKKSTVPLAILIPQTINRENLLTIALAFSKFNHHAFEIEMTSEITQTATLQKLATLFNKKTKTPAKKIIITTKAEQLNDFIKQNKLFPTALHYQNTKKLKITNELQTFIDSAFPLPKKPQNQLEKEKKALELFTAKYKKEILNLLLAKPQLNAYTSKHLLLQNANICLTTTHKNICETNKNISLKNNLQTAIKKLPKNAPLKKLFLLTSLKEIKINTPLATDEGAAFRYGTKQSLILPHEKNEKINTYILLKQQAGLNPEYHSKKMKFYKFKTTEININDNI